MHRSKMQLLAVLSTVGLMLPVLISSLALYLTLSKRDSLIDWNQVSSVSHRSILLAALALAPTNLEALQLVPWRERRLHGFPSSLTVVLGAIATFSGDPLQIAVQAVFLTAGLRRWLPDLQLEARNKCYALSMVTLTFAAASVWSRGLRKLVILCSRKAQTSPYLYPDSSYQWMTVIASKSAQIFSEESIEVRCQKGHRVDSSSNPNLEPAVMVARTSAMRWLSDAVGDT